MIRHVILASALHDTLIGMRSAIGFGWITRVAAGMVAAHVGLRQRVPNASNSLRTDIVVVGVMVDTFGRRMRWVESKLVPWPWPWRMSAARVPARVPARCRRGAGRGRARGTISAHD